MYAYDTLTAKQLSMKFILAFSFLTCICTKKQTSAATAPVELSFE
jgi:hypothetical protein